MASGLGNGLAGMSFLARLFKPYQPPVRYRKCISHIVDDDGYRVECTLEYANKGYDEGWLVLSSYRLDVFDNTEHCEYRHV
jgi:hypothetical protein